MNTEALIELVRQHKILYDITDPYYLNSNKKNSIWRHIGRELKSDGSACKSRWNNIRDQFRKSLKKTITKSGRQKFYRYHEQMSFLRPFLNERESTSNTIRQSDYNITDTALDSSSQHSTHSLLSLLESRQNIEQSPNSLNHSEEQDSNAISNSSLVITPRLSIDQASELRSTPSPRFLESPQEAIKIPNSAAGTLIEYLLKKKNEDDPLRNTVEEHPIDKFLQCIAPTLKCLTPYYQNLAKSDIFTVVQKYEMAMFTQNKETQNDGQNQNSNSIVSEIQAIVKIEK
ncbi:uncharacterized protein LOC113519007 [Galleria mellonella]|uniref:Uncharacterized protein LOC113519007 n=1 Tax=Galleria mellonella TaxID=7137 RepID=A0A6J1X2J0_GALME|nr:uncharacterized protein LOC113519007 [Galleria mellonella]